MDRRNAEIGFDSFAHLVVQYHSHRFVATANQILAACLWIEKGLVMIGSNKLMGYLFLYEFIFIELYLVENRRRHICTFGIYYLTVFDGNRPGTQ